MQLNSEGSLVFIDYYKVIFIIFLYPIIKKLFLEILCWQHILCRRLSIPVLIIFRTTALDSDYPRSI
jgi:hypothetical protein